MTDRTDAIVQALFNKPSLQDCSLQQVDYMAHQYPYFTTAQLLLLQKCEPASAVFKTQLQRTALHFSNPLQLTHWLHPLFFETEIPEPQLFQNPMPEAGSVIEIAHAEKPEGLEETHVSEPDNAEQKEPAAHQQLTPTQMEEPAVETPATEKAIEPATPDLTFEPYHTVDYFASQGIKLSQQEASSDTLGKQLKSFTEWLKTMKRLPKAAIAQTADAAGEQKVENLAAHSLDAPDVVTESMAEVWLKQGATEKAADVYHKLSLRNPSKSAYFAAKIESLKHS